MDLADSLSALTRLSSDGLTLEAMLTEIAVNAVRAIPGADGAGLTLRERDRADTMVITAPFVEPIEAFQYGLGEGPCIDAATHGRTVRSASLGGDHRWPRFGPRVGRLGVHSVLALPLVTPAGIVGAMNVYAYARDTFDDRAQDLGEAFAAPAAIVVRNAQLLAQTERLVSSMQAAMTNRAVIDQAIGILRSRSGLSAQEAFDRLRRLSQHEHRKLAVVADGIVEEAVSRARARVTGPGEPV